MERAGAAAGAAVGADGCKGKCSSAGASKLKLFAAAGASAGVCTVSASASATIVAASTPHGAAAVIVAASTPGRLGRLIGTSRLGRLVRQHDGRPAAADVDLTRRAVRVRCCAISAATDVQAAAAAAAAAAAGTGARVRHKQRRQHECAARAPRIAAAAARADRAAAQQPEAIAIATAIAIARAFAVNISSVVSLSSLLSRTSAGTAACKPCRFRSVKRAADADAGAACSVRLATRQAALLRASGCSDGSGQGGAGLGLGLELAGEVGRRDGPLRAAQQAQYFCGGGPPLRIELRRCGRLSRQQCLHFMVCAWAASGSGS